MNSTAHRPANPLAVSLAGLQAGMIGICWMLAWLGLSAIGQRRSFWTAENLMASVFHGNAAIRRGFGASTLSGIALYLLIYSLLGALFAVTARDRFTGLGTVLLGVLVSVGWYCLWFRVLGQARAHLRRECIVARHYALANFNRPDSHRQPPDRPRAARRPRSAGWPASRR